MKDETTQCDECGRHFYIGHAICPECGTENPDYDYGDEVYGDEVTGEPENEEDEESEADDE